VPLDMVAVAPLTGAVAKRMGLKRFVDIAGLSEPIHLLRRLGLLEDT
jgi:hypothetical protein